MAISRALEALVGLALLATQTSAAAEQPAVTIAVVDVTVLPMAGPERLAHQTVLVSGGRIVTIGDAKSITPPRGAQVIDGRSKFLMPGISDMHVHMFTAIGRDAYSADRAKLELLSFLATGITTVRNMAGSPTHLSYRRAIAAGEVFGPSLFVSSPAIEGAKPVWSFSPQVTDPAAAEPLVAGYAQAGYDQIKVYHTLSAPVYGSIVEAARRHRVKVVGHVPFEVGIEGALNARQYTIEHFRGYDFDGMSAADLEKEGGRSAERFSVWSKIPVGRLRELARRTADARIWNTPTMSVNKFLADSEARTALARDPRMALLPQQKRDVVTSSAFDTIFSKEARDAIRASFPRQRQFIKMLDDEGAGLLVGTDVEIPYLVPGFTAIEEIGEFVKAGLTSRQALEKATIMAAKSVGAEDDLGTVSVGKRANLILLTADPLIDTANLWQLEGVIAGGRWARRADLEKEIRRLVRALPPPAR